MPPGPELAEGHDHVELRWRHLDTCQFETVLVSPGAEAALGRRQCVDGAGALSAAEWARALAEARNRFTALFEQMAITVPLAACSLNRRRRGCG